MYKIDLHRRDYIICGIRYQDIILRFLGSYLPMAQYFEIHPDNPQQRLIQKAQEILDAGGVAVCPTDSSYALICHLGDKRALDRIRRIRQLDDRHNFTLVCDDLAQVSRFTKISNESFRLIKTLTPGAFTFVLPATREVPRRLQHPKRKTVGVRIPDNQILQALVSQCKQPLFTTTLILPGEKEAIADAQEIRERIEHEVDLIIDGGIVLYEPTTIVVLTDKNPEVVRQGKGQTSLLDQL